MHIVLKNNIQDSQKQSIALLPIMNNSWKNFPPLSMTLSHVDRIPISETNLYWSCTQNFFLFFNDTFSF